MTTSTAAEEFHVLHTDETIALRHRIFAKAGWFGRRGFLVEQGSR